MSTVRANTGFKSFFLLGMLGLTACAHDAQANDDSEALASAECPSGSIDGGVLDATTPASDDASTGDAAVDGGLTTPPDTLTVPSKDGTYFASVIANGTGCPAGTWNTSISPDGQRFTTTFSAYESSVDDKTQFSNRDCTLSIKLRSPAGLSYSVGSFRYTGFMLLEQDVELITSAQYWFQGRAQPPTTTNRVSYVGPQDREFVFSDEVDTTDAVWSECGNDRDLNIKTLASVRNSTPRRSGYASIAMIDSNTLEFFLNTRKCATSSPAVVKPAGGKK